MIPIAIVVVAMIVLCCLRSYLWGEKKAKEPEKTVTATVLYKEVKRGTRHSGRSNGGYSYAVAFLTEDGTQLELYAYEVEFGGLKEGTEGKLTYRGRYFIDFEEI